ncbi:fumarate reductase/succinate dehydrogenase flavoprotein domain-containing protein [Thauera linaloolentis 47Lol = DSM 12138]|uniref:Fumarate reductase/succinate dehydrogenase flavoprotein domain-containing protein n=1 Tax=Thauera linaloolentis (strain DSM 12138 / JCM 21573 / CCUG 41526 / CIP 105981 / IAM 15112 / NBRC 102519 / 47Lol) TaxID=1123367 RepID=N6XQM9_THAL4|nr:fumarate reductase/succinate dehydrogenase flavoprotein domain-containing protein [Thauera linaloolentis 47Lol = DSM 12138]
MRPVDGSRPVDSAALVQAVQRQVLPLEINYFRSEAGLRRALAEVDALWPEAGGQPQTGTPQQALRSREAAAMTAAARWIFTAALGRRETRASHTLAEYPATDPAQQHRLILSGVDRIALRPEAVPA